MLKKNLLHRNSIPFLILGIIHLVFFYQLMKHKQKKSTWILLFSNIGFTYLFEYFVLNLFQAYRYRPHILKNRALDNIFGAILSQALYVPIAATFLTMFQKSWKWKLGFSFSYFLIENLFIRLKIYKENWWNPIYSLLLINIYFLLSDNYYKLIMVRKKWALQLAHYFTIVVVGVTLLYVHAVRRKIQFGLGLFFSWKEHFRIAPLYSLFVAFITFLYTQKSGILYRLLNLQTSLLIDSFLVKIGILKIRKKFTLENILSHCIMIFLSRRWHRGMVSKVKEHV